MNSMIDLNKPRVSETEIIDIAIEFLIDERPISECRGYLLSEYDLDARDLARLLEKASEQVEEWKLEIGSQLRF